MRMLRSSKLDMFQLKKVSLSHFLPRQTAIAPQPPLGHNSFVILEYSRNSHSVNLLLGALT